jgi:hypothetical protein
MRCLVTSWPCEQQVYGTDKGEGLHKHFKSHNNGLLLDARLFPLVPVLTAAILVAISAPERTR